MRTEVELILNKEELLTLRNAVDGQLIRLEQELSQNEQPPSIMKLIKPSIERMEKLKLYLDAKLQSFNIEVSK